MMGKGWTIPGSATKAHYFNDSDISLCRKWAFLLVKSDSIAFDDSQHEHKDNCAICKRKKLAMDAKATV